MSNLPHGDVDPSEIFDALGIGKKPQPVAPNPLAQSHRGIEEGSEYVPDGERSPDLSDKPTMKEALRDWLVAGQKLMEAMEREEQS